MWQTEAYRLQAQRLEDVVGGKAAKLFEALRVRTVGDAVRLVPRRYLRGAEDSNLRNLQVGEDAAFIADVVDVKQQDVRVQVIVSDGTAARVSMTFFLPTQPKQRGRAEGLRAFYAKHLHVGARGLFVGKIGVFNNMLQLAHPAWVVLDEHGAITGSSERADMGEIASSSGLIGIYPATAKLKTWTVARTLRFVVDQLGDDLADPLPDEVLDAVDIQALARTELGIAFEPPPGSVLPRLRAALDLVHRPQSRDDAWLGHQRLLFDEAFAVQATMAYRRFAARAEPATPRTPREAGLLAAFDAALPFELTNGQKDVSSAIFADLARDYPMQKLLQGEVGSGKTLVALRAMLAVVDAGGQAALLAPTEVLAQQHHRTIVDMLGPLADGAGLFSSDLATRVTLLSGSMATSAKRRALLEIASGEAGIVIGTHALLSDVVSFADLGLVVIDEQHRFGVEQRAALNEKAETRPHVLVMTATPIPRTVAMTVFGDLEVVTLREIPAGRSPVTTSVVPEKWQSTWVGRAWARVAEEVAAGRQAFIVCPQITATDKSSEAAGIVTEESAHIVPRNVTELYAELVAGPLAHVRVAPLHGQMPSDEKESVMRRFADGEIDVLIATTVVEVGVNVPNATMMVISDADRFGISQLHQLRGRIGRGSHPGVCVLLTQTERDTVAAQRLLAIAATRDGFDLAEADLAQRREGDVLGAAQAGVRSSLKLLRVLDHAELIRQTRDIAEEWVRADPELRHPGVADAVRLLEENAAAEWLERA